MKQAVRTEINIRLTQKKNSSKIKKKYSYFRINISETFQKRIMLTQVKRNLSDRPTQPFQGSGESNGSRVVRFYGDVNAWTCSSLVQELRRLDESGSSDPIHIHIQSYGGEISPMFYVLDCIDSLSSPIWTYVDGYAASAATLLSVYGEKRFMSKRSFILIHQLRGGLFGTHAEMMAGTEFNSRQNEIMKEVYLKRTLLSDQQIETLFRKDVWLPASSCLKHGIVDGIVNGETRREEGDETKVATRKTREGRRTKTIPFATKEGWNPVSPLL